MATIIVIKDADQEPHKILILQVKQTAIDLPNSQAKARTSSHDTSSPSNA